MKKYSILFVALFAFVFFSCSSSPKRAMLVTQISDSAAAIYETANGELIAGQIENAGEHLQQAYNMALTVDDADLLCKISLSAIIYKLTRKPVEKKPGDCPFADLNADDLLGMAKEYAYRSDETKLYKSICSIYEARINLAFNRQFNGLKTADELKNSSRELSKEPYYLAFSKRTLGDVYASINEYDKALSSYLEAAHLHTKHRYLSEIGLDYYCAARMSSLKKNKSLALAQIDTALKYDKDAENTVAIAADYNAYGLIILKDGCSSQEKERAKNAIIWAGKIYKSGGFAEEAQNCFDYAAAL